MKIKKPRGEIGHHILNKTLFFNSKVNRYGGNCKALCNRLLQSVRPRGLHGVSFSPDQVWTLVRLWPGVQMASWWHISAIIKEMN